MDGESSGLERLPLVGQNRGNISTEGGGLTDRYMHTGTVAALSDQSRR